jgi:hypothetical protein
MTDPQPLLESQPAMEAHLHHHRHSHRHHRHGPTKRMARILKRYRTPILIVIGLMVLLVVWYMVASYEPKSPLT